MGGSNEEGQDNITDLLKPIYSLILLISHQVTKAEGCWNACWDCEQPFLKEDTLSQGTTQTVVGCSGWGGGNVVLQRFIIPRGGENNLFEIHFLFAMSVDDSLTEL